MRPGCNPALIRYYITDRTQLGTTESERTARLLACVRRACAAAVDYVQLREKDLPLGDLERLAREVLRVMGEGERGPKLLINSRADVALAVGADGVHLPSGVGALPASEVRALWAKVNGVAPVIGVSCHSLDEVLRAEAHGADFAVFGPVFDKKGVGNQNGLELLRDICHSPQRARPAMPTLALGGVTEQNAAECMTAGAAGIGGIRMWQ
ncbi:MAG TPA: thiamine phosphate synthase [Terriglobales bacterium]